MKKLFLLFIVSIFVFSIFSTVLAQTEETIVSVSSATGSLSISYLYTDSGSADVDHVAGVSVSFSSETNSRWLSSVSFGFFKIGSPVCHLRAGLFSYSTNTLLEWSSDYIEASSLTTSNGGLWYRWNFSGTYELVAGMQYRIGVVVDDADTLSEVNCPVIKTKVVTEYQAKYLYNSVWNTESTDFIFAVRGYDAPLSTPTPSPSPTVASAYPPGDPFVAVPSYYMVLLVLFAVVAVLAGLYVTFEREGENKGVALLFVLVGLVLFVILIVGYLVGF